MKERAIGFEKVALTTAAIQLPPRATAGMTVCTDIPQTGPAAVATVGIRTELVRGVDLATASPCRDDTRWRANGWFTVRLDGLLTRLAVGLTGEARKGFGACGAFAGRRQRLRGFVKLLRLRCSSGKRVPLPSPIRP